MQQKGSCLVWELTTPPKGEKDFLKKKKQDFWKGVQRICTENKKSPAPGR